MIADSPYAVRPLVITPFAGLTLGVFGSGVTAGLALLVSPAIGSWLVGSADIAGGVQPMRPVIWIGCWSVVALLFAVCQGRARTQGHVAVGLLFGVMIWAVSALVGGMVSGDSLRMALRSWQWLVVCLTFGLWMGVWAVVAQARRPVERLARD